MPNMNKHPIIQWIFIATLVLVPLGGFLKILHDQRADFFLQTGMICVAITMAVAIYEVRSSSRLNRNEKYIWTIGLIFLSAIALPLYYLNVRKRQLTEGK